MIKNHIYIYDFHTQSNPELGIPGYIHDSEKDNSENIVATKKWLTHIKSSELHALGGQICCHIF